MSSSAASALTSALHALLEGASLDADAAEAAMTEIMAGEASEAVIAGYLVALRMKGETPDEVVGSARAMRAAATPFESSRRPLLDTCGTGGDGSGTFNISTGAALVAAAAGVVIAKHGNRSVSSKCGSADVLAELGLPVDVEPKRAEALVDRHGFAFLFAPRFHGSMRHAMGTRQALKARTVFNLLGPLTNPAGAETQVMGVYAESVIDLAAEALRRLGTRRAFVVHSEDGLDEVSLAAPTHVVDVSERGTTRGRVGPEDFGLARAPREAIAGGDAATNARILESVFAGEKGAPRDAVVMNAALAFVAAGKTDGFAAGARLAESTIDEGRVRELLAALRAEAE